MPLFQGHVTGLNVYSSRVDFDLDPNTCLGNHGDVISWLEFDKCVKQDLSTMQRPTGCPTSKGDYLTIYTHTYVRRKLLVLRHW